MARPEVPIGTVEVGLLVDPPFDLLRRIVGFVAIHLHLEHELRCVGPCAEIRARVIADRSLGERHRNDVALSPRTRAATGPHEGAVDTVVRTIVHGPRGGGRAHAIMGHPQSWIRERLGRATGISRVARADPELVMSVLYAVDVGPRALRPTGPRFASKVPHAFMFVRIKAHGQR